jgi:hypothetical protein
MQYQIIAIYVPKNVDDRTLAAKMCESELIGFSIKREVLKNKGGAR